MSAAALLELAKKRFGDRLTDADKRLFGTTAGGNVAYYGKGKPAEADTWGKDRVLRADRIEWLCTDRKAVKEVTHKGVWIQGARIEGQLQLSYAKIAFPLSIENSAVREGMVFERARLAAFFLSGTHTGPIHADGLRVDYDLLLRNGFHATGEVRLLGAKIGGNLDCVNGHFSNPNGVALSIDGVDVGGDVFFSDGFQATGEVRLLGAKIGGNLECINGHFSNPTGYALNADGVEVKGSVFLREQFQAEGVVDFVAATVGWFFHWRNVKNPELCTLRLESARIGTLWDERDSWPATLYLDGLVYDRLDNEAPVGWKERLKWLRLQDYDKFVPQPYVQLGKVLNEMGHETDARKILIAKQEDPARLKAMTRAQRAGHHVLGWTIGYGYQPWMALWWILGFMFIGTVFFWIGSARFAETKEGTAPTFNAIVYSIDVFVPLVDLHQVKYRLPTGWWLRSYLWIHIGLGWVLTTLFVVGLTGLVRRE